MKFVHGSPTDIYNTGRPEFCLFDYKTNPNDDSPGGHVNNGIDQYGPGIYAYPGDQEHYKSSIEKAACYTSKESGYIYVLSVDTDSKNLINNQDTYAIDEEIWVAVVERFVSKIRDKFNYSQDTFENLVSDVINMANRGEELSDDLVVEKFSQFKDMDFEYLKPSNFDDIYSWEEEARGQYEISEPASHVFEEGGSEKIVQYALNGSDNLWGVLKSIWNSIAVSNSVTGYMTYNETFQESVFEVFDEYEIDDFKVAKVNEEFEDNYFFVIFDTRCIKIEKTIDLSRSQNNESTMSL